MQPIAFESTSSSTHTRIIFGSIRRNLPVVTPTVQKNMEESGQETRQAEVENYFHLGAKKEESYTLANVTDEEDSEGNNQSGYKQFVRSRSRQELLKSKANNEVIANSRVDLSEVQAEHGSGYEKYQLLSRPTQFRNRDDWVHNNVITDKRPQKIVKNIINEDKFFKKNKQESRPQDMKRLRQHFNDTQQSEVFIPSGENLLNPKFTQQLNRQDSNHRRSNSKKQHHTSNNHRDREILEVPSNLNELLQAQQQDQLENKSKYSPAGLKILQFDEKEKFIIYDSKSSQNFQSFKNYEDFHLPKLPAPPEAEISAQDLIELAKATFRIFGCEVTSQTVISVKKYKNCVHFSLESGKSILWHYGGTKFYFGGWKYYPNGEGDKHGEGIESVAGKYKFKGNYSQGKKSGFGTMIGNDGTVYVGQWDSGLKHGSGTQIDREGYIYEGQWREGKRNGHGVIKHHGKLEFDGIFVRGYKNGHGREFFQNGDMYEGEYIGNKFEGKGTYYWASGAVYTGEFKQGKRSGFGIWKSAREFYDKYQGHYLEDKKHGKGIYTWATGAVYRGYFRDDLKHGQGTITYQNGKVASLVWVDGVVEKKVDPADLSYADYRRQSSASSKFPRSSSDLKRDSFRSNNIRVTANRPSSHSRGKMKSAHSQKNLNGLAQKNNRNSTFHSASSSANKIIRLSQYKKHNKFDETNMIKLKIPIEQSLGKTVSSKNLLVSSNRERKSNSRLAMPKDRPYQGMQASSNININL